MQPILFLSDGLAHGHITGVMSATVRESRRSVTGDQRLHNTNPSRGSASIIHQSGGQCCVRVPFTLQFLGDMRFALNGTIERPILVIPKVLWLSRMLKTLLSRIVNLLTDGFSLARTIGEYLSFPREQLENATT